MVQEVRQSIAQADGGAIYMPKWYRGEVGWGNLAHPNVYEAGVQGAWPRGTIYREGNRTFVYGKMDSTLGGAYNHAGYLPITYAIYKDIGSDGMQSGSAASRTVNVNYGGACVKDRYSGGILGFYGTFYGNRYIVKQDLADGSFNMDLLLDREPQGTLATTDEILLQEHQYKTLRLYVTEEYSVYMGVLCHDLIAVSEFNWLQTGGPHGMTFYWGTAEPDAGTAQVMVVAYHGTTQVHPSRTASLAAGADEAGSLQVIGRRSTFIDTAGAMSGGQTIWLTILE
jgi:hypothetical protein